MRKGLPNLVALSFMLLPGTIVPKADVSTDRADEVRLNRASFLTEYLICAMITSLSNWYT